MSGAADPIYVHAREVLLTALQALAEHRDAVVVVGAHAIYLHVSQADLQVAPFTTDADLALDPAQLREQPLIELGMQQAGFTPGTQPGQWLGPGRVQVDIMVPAAVAGAGGRGARIPPHGDRVARSARGLEAVLVDNEIRTVTALDPMDSRQFQVRVAGPAALMVSKLIKLGERIASRPNAVNAKDALDVFRLLRLEHDGLAQSLRMLAADDVAGATSIEALELLRGEFAARAGRGVSLVVQAMGALQDRAETEVQVSALSRRLLERI